MRSFIRNLNVETEGGNMKSLYKAIVFYEVGVPRVYDIPIDEDAKQFVRNVTKTLSESVQVLGWAIIDPVGGKVIRSEGLSDKMYEEMDSLLGVNLEREPGNVYKEEEGEEIPLGKVQLLPVHEIRTRIYREGKREG